MAAQGLQIGDVLADRAIVWSRADRPAQLLVEWDVSANFGNPRRLRGPHALATSDFTARMDLTDLPSGREIFVRAQFASLENARAMSEPVLGHFHAAPARSAPIRFVWGGDTAGQGFGINPEFGGMRICETMRARRPHFFLHSGDNIYADGPLPAELTVENGKVWRNIEGVETASALLSAASSRCGWQDSDCRWTAESKVCTPAVGGASDRRVLRYASELRRAPRCQR